MNIVIQYEKKQLWFWGGVLILILVGSIYLFASQKTTTQPTQSTTSTNTQAAQPITDSIAVDVTHTPPTLDGTHAFTIALNTHSGDLSPYDAQTNIVYLTKNGAELRPVQVGGDRETHHRSIVVTFRDAPLPGTLLVRNLGSIPERTFTIQ